MFFETDGFLDGNMVHRNWTETSQQSIKSQAEEGQIDDLQKEVTGFGSQTTALQVETHAKLTEHAELNAELARRVSSRMTEMQDELRESAGREEFDQTESLSSLRQLADIDDFDHQPPDCLR